MDEKTTKNLIKALVIHMSLGGIEPSYGAYQDRAEEMEKDLQDQVDEIYETFKNLKD